MDASYKQNIEQNKQNMKQYIQYDLHEVQNQAKLKHTILRHILGSKITKNS